MGIFTYIFNTVLLLRFQCGFQIAVLVSRLPIELFVLIVISLFVPRLVFLRCFGKTLLHDNGFILTLFL